MVSRFVTVATYGGVLEAEVARAHLEAEGVTAEVRDAHTASLGGQHMVGVLGGIRLEVLEQDLERALEILRSGEAKGVAQDVFLVRMRRLKVGLFIGAVIGGGIGFALAQVTGDLAIVVTLTAVGALLGLVVGSRSVHYECSDPACCATNPRGAAVCAGCGGTVRGEIKDRNQRLAALEELDL